MRHRGLHGGAMQRSVISRAIIGIAVIAILPCWAAAQGEGDDNPRGNTNLGFTITAPLDPTGKIATSGVGMTAGAGYNFTRRHAIVSEFMWNHLFIDNSAIGAIRDAAQNSGVTAGSDVYSFTGNYRFELRGKALGTYLIGGGGWYLRRAHMSETVTTGQSIICSPELLWWGFSCETGTVTANQTVKGSSSNALGFNGGIGFTARVGDAPYRIYVESRYHYAPTKGISTQLATITVGIRY